MKKIIFGLLVIFGFGVVIGCGSGGGGGVKRPPVEDHVSIRINMMSVAEYTYSLSTPPPSPAFPGSIGFAASVTKNNSGAQADPSDITWSSTGDNVGTFSPVPSSTGAELVLNNNLGTMVVKATYLEGTIDEMSKTVTIHVVA